ncbi:hypothetical protein Vadar_019719 [Vaccinium darrowii]|uniref:Uncharacterized protein n=1 Tax=Vaccinium darrowii TaxID=229202 RepID=A0ACB7XAZ7_9ERIC|nr:hypothetical protein Vadar_019719 [Vaccinium darrowii]
MALKTWEIKNKIVAIETSSSSESDAIFHYNKATQCRVEYSQTNKQLVDLSLCTFLSYTFDAPVTLDWSRGSQEQEAQPHSLGIPTNSWYPPSVVSSPTSSRPGTPSSTFSSCFSLQRPVDRPQTLSHVSPTMAAGINVLLKDKRSTYGTQSQGFPHSEVVALKQQVADQKQLFANQGKVLADYDKKLEKMMLMLATGV